MESNGKSVGIYGHHEITETGESFTEVVDGLGTVEGKTGSDCKLKGVLPVTRVGDRPVGDGRPGPLTRRVAEIHDAEWRAFIAGD